MKEFNMTGLRETLEKLPTDQLDAMLRAELEKEPLDEHAVRIILKVLRSREADYPVEYNEQIGKAWEEYKDRTMPRKSKLNTTLFRVASVLLIVGALIVVLPQEANARNFFDRIVAWTDSIFELFSPSDSGRQKAEYEFHTDHPGLQEVYDVVIEIGVTVPVVPMWLPDGYELVECTTIEESGVKIIRAGFSDGDTWVMYQLNVYADNIGRQFHKNDGKIVKYEKKGTIYNIIRNEDLWVVVWTVENIECSIFVDCQEDTLCRIIDSIYTMED